MRERQEKNKRTRYVVDYKIILFVIVYIATYTHLCVLKSKRRTGEIISIIEQRIFLLF